MGKLFAVGVIVITLVSVFFFVRHTWWMPVDISTTGPAIDHQLEETMIGAGLLFLAGQLLSGPVRWEVPATRILRERSRYFPADQSLGGCGDHSGRYRNFDAHVRRLKGLGRDDTWRRPLRIRLQIDVQAEQFAFYFRYAGRTVSLADSIPIRSMMAAAIISVWIRPTMWRRATTWWWVRWWCR